MIIDNNRHPILALFMQELIILREFDEFVLKERQRCDI